MYYINSLGENDIFITCYIATVTVAIIAKICWHSIWKLYISSSSRTFMA